MLGKIIAQQICLLQRLGDHIRAGRLSKLPPHERWNAALPSEVRFWQHVINGTWPNPEYCADLRRRVSGQNVFGAHLHRFTNSESVTRILDVGAGPVSVLGPVGAPGQIEIVAIDPLADIYNALLDKQGFVPWNRTRQGDGEHLSELGLGLFDLVYSRNALDHSYDPVRAIREMVKVCKPGGAVFFEGGVNEAVAHAGAGLHQWNFLPVDDGDLIVWTEKQATSLRHALEPANHVTAHRSAANGYQVEIRHAC